MRFVWSKPGLLYEYFHFYYIYYFFSAGGTISFKLSSLIGVDDVKLEIGEAPQQVIFIRTIFLAAYSTSLNNQSYYVEM